MTLKDLSTLKFQEDRKSRPNIPEYAIPKATYSDKTASGLTKSIKAYCDLKGIFCQRSGSEGRYRPGTSVVDVIGRTRLMKGTWLPGHQKGIADLTMVVNGKYIGVEVKIGNDRQSDVQKEFETDLIKAGGCYVIVKSWDDFYKFIHTQLDTNNK